MQKAPTRRRFGVPIVSGPTRVQIARDVEEETQIVRASHDGYASRFVVTHQRTLVLSPDGLKLEGEDLFLPTKGDMIPKKVPDEFAVRFHLHPLVKVNRIDGGRGALLTLPNREAWNFHAHEDQIEIEEDVYLGGHDGPRRTSQIVIHGRAREAPRVRWTFTHVTPAAPASRRQRPGGEPELPLPPT